VRSTITCPHETDVLDLVAISQWPARADDALRSHVALCPICADLATVASAIADLDETTALAARVPDAGLVWYRAQLAARADMARRAARPMFVAGLAAGACAAGVGLLAWQAGRAWFGRLWSAPDITWASLPVWPEGLAVTAASWWWVWAAMGAWAALMPAAFWLARIADRGILEGQRAEGKGQRAG
jgi:hypothetical protein